MTPAATKETRIETSRWSLGLAIGLLLASLAAAGALVPRLAPHSPYKNTRAEAASTAASQARRERAPLEHDLSPILPAAAISDTDLRPGLVGEYFRLDESPADFSPLAALPPPALTRVDRQINFDRTDGAFALTDLRDGFTVRWTGLVRVPRDGRYRFFLRSDDGSRLLIDDLVVVENGGVHEMREASGEIDLKAGDHELLLEFFDHSGPAGCALSWESEGVGKDVIPERALFHRRSAERD
ncbi:MAG TPA: PA14 domain-containing protein [Planctomycetota bacterium]|nr:PA14 domain-containing protein [Planctomycetota bacterium]